MTKYYSFIRREIYELNVSKKQLNRRSLKQIIHLFKPLNLILYLIVTMCFIAALIIMILYWVSLVDLFWVFIPLLIICLLAMLADSLPEKNLFHERERNAEIHQEKALLAEYLENVKQIFDKYDLNNEGICLLKKECEERINKNKSKNSLFQNKIIDIITIAPIAAVISIAADANRSPNINAIVITIALGLMFLGIIKILTPLQGIWHNTHKDQCLLDTLNDLEYTNHKNKKE